MERRLPDNQAFAQKRHARGGIGVRRMYRGLPPNLNRPARLLWRWRAPSRKNERLNPRSVPVTARSLETHSIVSAPVVPLVAGLVSLQLGQQGLVVDLQRMSRLGFVPAAGLKDALNVQTFDLLERQLRAISRRDDRR